MPLAASKAVLTAATRDGFAVLPAPVVPDTNSFAIELTTSCAETGARVELVDESPDGHVMYAHRILHPATGSFGAEVAGGKAQLCLPGGAYYTHLGKGYVATKNAIFAPAKGEPTVRYLRTSVYDAPLDESGISPMTRADFAASVPSEVRVIAFGEANHGSQEFQEERLLAALEFSTMAGFRLIMIECGFGEVVALDDYISGRHVDLTRALTDLDMWVWDSEIVRESLEKLRAHNMSVPESKRIHICGFDVQRTNLALNIIGPSLPRADKEKLTAAAGDDGARWADTPAVVQSSVRRTLEDIATRRDGGGISSVKNRRALAAMSVLRRIDSIESQKRAPMARDRGMARMALDILSTSPASRAVMWAHLVHLGRELAVGLPSAGEHLAAALGSRYRVYAQLAYSGSVRAWDPKQEIGAIPHVLPAVHPGSVEWGLNRLTTAPISYWDFKSARPPASRWLSAIHRISTVTSVYKSDEEVAEPWDLRIIDGAVLFSRVSPAVLTPTGQKRASPRPRVK